MIFDFNIKGMLCSMALAFCGMTYKRSSEEQDERCRAVGALMNDI